jgi:nicotinamidase-related amidase
MPRSFQTGGKTMAKAMGIDRKDTAVVITDPQNDFLSEKGVTWGLVGKNVKENHTVENIERILSAAKKLGFEVFISPHYYYPTDDTWKFEGRKGNVENIMFKVHMFQRSGALSLDGFKGSGADWLERYKPFIEDGKTIVCSPHKVYGPENNDLILQLSKRRINRIILCGMSANLCTESHMRELIERGFEVGVVKDATAAAQSPELGDGYKAALINFKFLADAVFSTDEVVKLMDAQDGRAARVA